MNGTATGDARLLPTPTLTDSTAYVFLPLNQSSLMEMTLRHDNLVQAVQDAMWQPVYPG
ncbi:MAG: hypothetical protein E7A72_05165 [Actinomyces urogenitalis]|uniref:hypothetical protein n=1 Tax=Actinomyces urogenitalis TaxID=103621 RepID=UPI001C60E06D|nr:hypothetical protein [Actinomyces urogenitalis]MDU0972268.1 hypothetical protein [Actinomyces urogenitalis]